MWSVSPERVKEEINTDRNQILKCHTYWVSGLVRPVSCIGTGWDGLRRVCKTQCKEIFETKLNGRFLVGDQKTVMYFVKFNVRRSL